MIAVRMARIFMDLGKDGFSQEIGHHQFDEFFCKTLQKLDFLVSYKKFVKLMVDFLSESILIKSINILTILTAAVKSKPLCNTSHILSFQ